MGKMREGSKPGAGDTKKFEEIDHTAKEAHPDADLNDGAQFNKK